MGDIEEVDLSEIMAIMRSPEKLQEVRREGPPGLPLQERLQAVSPCHGLPVDLVETVSSRCE